MFSTETELLSWGDYLQSIIQISYIPIMIISQNLLESLTPAYWYIRFSKINVFDTIIAHGQSIWCSTPVQDVRNSSKSQNKFY